MQGLKVHSMNPRQMKQILQMIQAKIFLFKDQQRLWGSKFLRTEMKPNVSSILAACWTGQPSLTLVDVNFPPTSNLDRIHLLRSNRLWKMQPMLLDSLHILTEERERQRHLVRWNSAVTALGKGLAKKKPVSTKKTEISQKILTRSFETHVASAKNREKAEVAWEHRQRDCVLKRRSVHGACASKLSWRKVPGQPTPGHFGH